jgi:hypothetical protein
MILRRILPIVALACAASGCASLQAALSDAPFDAAPDASTASLELTPQAAYDAGVLDLQRGDGAAARREWDRCLEISTADSPSRLDCMVAIERLAPTSPTTP